MSPFSKHSRSKFENSTLSSFEAIVDSFDVQYLLEFDGFFAMYAVTVSKKN